MANRNLTKEQAWTEFTEERLLRIGVTLNPFERFEKLKKLFEKLDGYLSHNNMCLNSFDIKFEILWRTSEGLLILFESATRCSLVLQGVQCYKKETELICNFASEKGDKFFLDETPGFVYVASIYKKLNQALFNILKTFMEATYLLDCETHRSI